jgi:hypothetical protein
MGFVPKPSWHKKEFLPNLTCYISFVESVPCKIPFILHKLNPRGLQLVCNSIDSPLSDAKTHLPIMPSGTKHQLGVSFSYMTYLNSRGVEGTGEAGVKF